MDVNYGRGERRGAVRKNECGQDGRSRKVVLKLGAGWRRGGYAVRLHATGAGLK
jgi:hypothetical protein